MFSRLLSYNQRDVYVTDLPAPRQNGPDPDTSISISIPPPPLTLKYRNFIFCLHPDPSPAKSVCAAAAHAPTGSIHLIAVSSAQSVEMLQSAAARWRRSKFLWELKVLKRSPIQLFVEPNFA